MKKLDNIPEDAMTVKTYDELTNLANACVNGTLGLTIILGPPGVGKMETICAAAGLDRHGQTELDGPAGDPNDDEDELFCEAHHIQGHMSPLGLLEKTTMERGSL